MRLFPFRANTQTAFIPLLSRHASQTVIDPSSDQTFVPNVSPTGNESPVDRGVPQVIYGHNIMPTTYGFQSVGYVPIYPAFTDWGARFEEVKLVISTTQERTYIAMDYTNTRRPYVLNPQTGKWEIAQGLPVGTLYQSAKVTVAEIRGRSLILIPGQGAYEYLSYSNSFNHVPLSGLSLSSIKGILSANGYLIAWTDKSIAWSAVNDPYDFTPSEITGAGGGAVEEARGNITHAQSTAYGFVIYTTNNAVGVTYSGNSLFPYNLRAISAAGGVKNSDYVCPETSNSQFAYTTNGLQQVSHSGGKTVLPAVTDFLAGQVIEDFDDDTKEFIINELNYPLHKKFVLVCDRYLVCSYGASSDGLLTHAVIVDIVQARTGKIKFEHTACFEHRNTNPEQDDTPRRSIGFIKPDGSTFILDFNTSNKESKGTILYGRFQVVRGNMTNLQRIEIDNLPADNSSVNILTSYDGKNFKNIREASLDLNKSEGLIQSYHASITAKSVSLLVQGQFDINGLVLFFQLGGDN